MYFSISDWSVSSSFPPMHLLFFLVLSAAFFINHRGIVLAFYFLLPLFPYYPLSLGVTVLLHSLCIRFQVLKLVCLNTVLFIHISIPGVLHIHLTHLIYLQVLFPSHSLKTYQRICLKFSTRPGIVPIWLQLPWWGLYWEVNLYGVSQEKRHWSFLSMSFTGQFAPSQPIFFLWKLGVMLFQSLLLLRSRHLN